MGVDFLVTGLLYASLMGSVLAGIIIIIRRVLRTRMDANWQYLLWFLLVIKLLIPNAPESPFSIFNLFHKVSMTWAVHSPETRIRERDGGNSDEVLSLTKLTDATGDYALSVNRNLKNSGYTIFLGVWITGVIFLIAFMTHLTWKLRRIIKSSLVVNDPGIAGLLEECRRKIHIKADPVLIESPAIQTPKVVGAIRPHIILPAGIIGTISRAELRFILLHELAHLQRRDLYINWVTTFLQIIHWFNPLIWYAFYQMRLDRELACDAYVLSRLKPGEYKNYGAAIIAFLERYSYRTYNYPIAGFASGKAHIKQRMTMISGYKRGTVAGVAGRILLLLMMGCLLLTNAKGTTTGGEPGQYPGLRRSVADDKLSRYFQGYDGAFVLFDLKKDDYVIYNDANSKRRVSPDSTYKIESSLVGLETGALADENTGMKWDGTVYPFEPWNRDQTLASAMASSVSWYFQKVDSQVGLTLVDRYLKETGYGNHDLSGGIRDFWGESSLKISPLEQVEFLRKFYRYELPFSRRNIDIVKQTIKLAEEGQGTLYGKTGTGIVNGKNINGWFVGYVERSDGTYIFATNIQGKDRADGANARKITLSILKGFHIL